jgi:trans-2,3-dihydro-3-hydroxyanthranilate isomerase
VADGDHLLAASLDGGAQVARARPRSQPVVRLADNAEAACERVARLAGAQERAREDRVRLHALVAQLLAERPRLLLALGRQRAQLVGLAVRCLGVAHEVEAHSRENSGVATFRYVVCDVFTDRPLAGNQLAVFTDARELSEELMQPLAREINFSETVFVLPSDKAHARIRIFTPRAELPFAGHPTLGSAFVLAGPLQLDEIRLETGNGIVPVRLEREGARIVFGRMEQPLPTVAAYPDESELLDVLGVERSELPVEVYDNGIQHVYVALGSEEEVASLRPDPGRLADMPSLLGVNCFAGSGLRWKTRMFAPGGGVPEDPATGSAAGPLAVHLARHGRIAFGEEIEISQGVEIGRPSTLYARAEGSAGALERVEVGGSAVVVARGEFRL